jgi:hypothetical protein
MSRLCREPRSPIHSGSWRASQLPMIKCRRELSCTIDIGCSRPLGATQIWKTSAPPRIKLFFWLVLHKKCWTPACLAQEMLDAR